MFDNPPDNDPAAPPVYTEVRLRQFFRTEEGLEVMPTLAIFVVDGVPTVDVKAISNEIARTLREQVPGKLRPSTREEIGRLLHSEVAVGNFVASTAKAAHAALPSE